MSNEITFKDLSFKKKLDHIWTYYRYHILAAVIGVIVVCSMINTIFLTPDPLMDVLMVDAGTGSDSSSFHDFLTEYGYEIYDDAVALNNNLRFYGSADLSQLSEAEQAQLASDNYTNQQVLFAILAAGGTEVMFGRGEVFLSYTGEGLFADLSDILSPELLAQYEDQLVYVEVDGVTYPCAVALTDHPWLTENGYYTDCYFGVLYRADDPEIAARFAEYLLSYTP